MTLRFIKKHRSQIGKIAASAAIAALLAMAVTGPAQADDRDWRRHQQQARHYHVVHPHYVRPAPVVYAPPVVYAAPPQPSGLNLIFPLNIR